MCVCVGGGGGGGRVSRKTSMYTKKSRKPDFGVYIYIYLSQAMTGDHVTQPAFSCISSERKDINA